MEIVIILILILLNGVLSMCEIALVSARKTSISADAKRGSKSAKTVLKITDNPNRFLSTIQIGITLIGILTGLFSGEAVADDLAAVLANWGLSQTIAYDIAQITIVIIVTYLTLILGELVPKRIGMSSPENIAKKVAGPMMVISWIASPLVWILDKGTELFVTIFRISENETKVTEEEIKSMIAEGAEDGEVQEVEQDIVERVFSLGDRKIESIMTSRNEIVWLDISMTRDEIYKTVSEHLFEVYPVGNGSLDEIVGVVYLKDLFVKISAEDFDLRKMLQKAQHFHEYTDVFKVLEQMKQLQVAYGLICDEFGVCQGIVTHKDLLEGLVGTVDTESEPDIIERKNAEGWLVSGQCPFYDFLEYFNLEELEEDNDYNTIGGLILELLEHIPSSGESVSWYDFHFEIIDMDGARIDKVLATRIPKQEENIQEEK